MQADPSTALPKPDADSLRHSRRVAEHLRARIAAAGGSIAFGEFMQEALYAPGLGYYSAGARKFGPGGDFVTAPELSPLFARVLARQVAPLMTALGGADVLELGAGSGALICELMRSLAAAGTLPGRYRVLEVSPELRRRQQARVAAELPGLAQRVTWLDRLPAAFRGVVIANEVADALPVERFVTGGDGVRQLRIAVDGDAFCWRQAPAPAWLGQRVRAIETDLGVSLPEGYLSELSPGLGAWIGGLAAALSQGFVFLFDYGVSRREYYAPDRNGGWLRCHFRHRAHDDPLILPGIQDLTAWVDFTAVAQAASAAGLAVAGFVTQSRFLLDGGLLEEFAQAAGADAVAQAELSQQVKLLTLPGEMGEHFKCMGLARGALPWPHAVTAGDRAHAL